MPGLSAQGHSVTITQPRPVVYGQGVCGKGPLTPGPVLAGEFSGLSGVCLGILG